MHHQVQSSNKCNKTIPTAIKKSQGSLSPTQQQKRQLRILKNRLAQRRRRAKKKLLFPVYHLCTNDDMKKDGVQSWFSIHAGEYEYRLHLSNWEIYSTKLGSIFLHGREVLDPLGKNGPTHKPTRQDYKVDEHHWIEIQNDIVQSLDTSNDILHVLREGAPLLNALSYDPSIRDLPYKNGTLDINFSLIVNGLMTPGVGSPDGVRSPDSWRINFGFNEFGTPTSFGKVDQFLGPNARAFNNEVGRIAELLCASMMIMQIAAGKDEIMSDNARDYAFAAKLRNRLGLGPSSPMRAEMIAICTMKISPTCPFNKPHHDVKNPEDPRYNRNGTFSAVVADHNGHLHLLQVLVASRRYAVTLGKMGVH